MELAPLLVLAVTVHCAEDFGGSPTNFSLELLHLTSEQTGGHLVISPFGIWTVMTAVALGATGDSFQQLSRALILPGDEASIISGYKQLTDVVLNPKADEVQVTSKNFLFLHQTFTILPDFNSMIQNDFGAAVKVLNFNDPNSADVANSYIEVTSGKEKNVLKPEDFIDSQMILVNVVSFKGLWSSPFKTSNTAKEPFYDEENKVIGSVNMMYQEGHFPSSNVKELESLVLELPYGNDGKYSMIFILPNPKVKVSKVNKKLANFGVKDVLKALQNDVDENGLESVQVKIPRFHISTTVDMIKPLKDMGIYDIFEPNMAKLEKLSRESIFITTVIQKSDIEVTEAGTVASAVSVVEIEDRMLSSLNFLANRPFVYWVLEKSTTTVLFDGIYSNPEEF